jgi:hypothetical protein
MKVAPSVAMAALLLTGCGTSEKTITLTQRSDDPVELVFLDLNPAGDTGDLTTFEAGLYLDDEPYGAIMGTMTKVGSVGAGANPNREERLLTAVFDLPEGQISVQGVSYYFEDDTLLAPGQPMTRAIIGGTGDYVGVDGEVTTTRNPDDSYTHVLSIVN